MLKLVEKCVENCVVTTKQSIELIQCKKQHVQSGMYALTRFNIKHKLIFNDKKI